MTGALVVNGGVGVRGNIYTGGNLNVSGKANITNSEASTSSMTGALVVNGGIGVGGNIYTGGILNVSGTATAGSFYSKSDYRIKDNIISLNKTPFNIDNIRPVYYYNKLTHNQDIGFIAHEIQEKYPFLVSGEKDGKEFQNIQYNGFIGLLVKEIQELKENKKTTDLIIQNLNEKVLNIEVAIQSIMNKC